nr:unnamed protein product [Callosobruchus chinensis]
MRLLEFVRPFFEYFENIANICNNCLEKKQSGGMIAVDERGRHGNHSRVPEFIKQRIREHIMQIPAMESHYSRERCQRNNTEEKRNLQCEYENHLAEASKRYQLKKTDKEECAKYSASKIMLTVDLQKCLPTPLLTNSQSFYSLKLWTYNYTLTLQIK